MNSRISMILKIVLVVSLCCVTFGLVMTIIPRYFSSFGNLTYRILQHVPYEREVAWAGLGDTYATKHDYEKALSLFSRADLVAASSNKCTIKIKHADISYTLANTISDKTTKQRYLQGAVDKYESCLLIEPTNELAKDHKQIVTAELQKLLKTETQQNGSKQSQQSNGGTNPAGNGYEQNDGTTDNEGEIKW